VATRIARWIIVGVIVASGSAIAFAAPPPSRPSFGTTPVSLPSTGAGDTSLVGLRVTAKAGFDRVVLAFKGGRPRATVGYVRAIEIVSDPPVPGAKPTYLPLAGNAALQITAFESGVASALQRRLSAGILPELRVVRELRLAPGFGGVVPLGAGLRLRVPFRVLTLAKPPRLVIDLMHPSR